MTSKLLTWTYVAILAVAIFLIGMAAHRALAYSGYDPLVAYFQNIFQTQPGGIIPVDPRFPNMPRLRYLQTKILPNGVYAVYVQKM